MKDPIFKKVTMSTKYVIDGKSYSSLDEMPPEVRAKIQKVDSVFGDSGLLKDKDGDGIPDIIQSGELFADLQMKTEHQTRVPKIDFQNINQTEEKKSGFDFRNVLIVILILVVAYLLSKQFGFLS